MILCFEPVWDIAARPHGGVPQIGRAAMSQTGLVRQRWAETKSLALNIQRGWTMASANVLRTVAFAILGGFVLALPAQAALSCYKAKSKVERLICDDKNPDLYSSDIALNVFYEESLARVENDKAQSFIEEQKKWIKKVRNVCEDAQCLRKVYQPRVSELQEIATLCRAEQRR